MSARGGPPSTRMGYFFILKSTLLFLEQFWYTATLSRNGRDSPNVPTCTAPPHTPFVTLSDPTVTRHHHPESRVDIRGHSWWCTFCVGFGQMHDDIYLPWQWTQNGFTTLKILWLVIFKLQWNLTNVSYTAEEQREVARAAVLPPFFEIVKVFDAWKAGFY